MVAGVPDGAELETDDGTLDDELMIVLELDELDLDELVTDELLALDKLLDERAELTEDIEALLVVGY